MTDERLERYYRELGDDALAEQCAQGPAAHRPDAWALLEAEANRRNAAAPGSVPPPPAPPTRAEQIQVAADALAAHIELLDRGVVMGVIIAIVGTLVTVSTFLAARGGGTYVIAWGAIVFGSIRALRSRGLRDDAKRRLAELVATMTQEPEPDAPTVEADEDVASVVATLDAEFAALKRDGKASAQVRAAYLRQREEPLRPPEEPPAQG